jgi:3-oxoadipate enol-lactonase
VTVTRIMTLALLLAGITTELESQSRSDRVPINGADLWYEVAGRGDALILIHGFSVSAAMWDAQMPALSPRFRVVRYDLRGHGRSGAPTPQHDAVGDLAGLMDRLDVRRAHLVGMSMGGEIAVDFALIHPDRVHSITLIGGLVSGFPYSGRWREWQAPIYDAGRREGIAQAKQLWLRSPVMWVLPDSTRIAASVRQMVDECPCPQFADRSLFHKLAEPRAFGRLHEIRAPMLVVVGDRDHPEILATADSIQARARAARKVVLPGTGHLVNIERATAVNVLLLNFLSTVK